MVKSTWYRIAIDGIIRFILIEGRKTESQLRVGVSGMVQIRTGTNDYFELGGQRFDQPRVAFALEHKGAFGNSYVMGNIGGDFLEPFVLALDD
ncbi:MAG: hypothetical protein O7G85_09190 [Planctomycetota bacterium]|nr:hypothetical protein [Planctomycetota bacterium]